MMDRRMFLQWLGIGGLASSLPMAIAACTPKAQVNSAATAFQSVGTIAQLDQSGQLLVREGSAAPTLVIRDPANSSNLIAVNPTCTHQGCEVAWQANQTAFVCPCHGARYDASGAVLQGPAERPLTAYTVKQDGETILVRQS
jgi:cytochrome b6-f complex iron-sulfur subunit